jgi:hypothetical protein
MKELIERIRRRVNDPIRAAECAEVHRPAKLYPPADISDIVATEGELGFQLSEFYRQLLIEVGNGGFGPGYGLAGVRGGAAPEGHPMVERYQAYRRKNTSDPYWVWPEKLVPGAALGCVMCWCVDCGEPDGPVTWFELNPRQDGEPWEYYLIPFAPSIVAWFEEWLSGENDVDMLHCGSFNTHVQSLFCILGHHGLAQPPPEYRKED